MQEKIQKIIKLNNFLDKHLKLENLKKQYINNLIEKIVIENFQRYQNKFNDLETYKQYLKNIFKKSMEIYNKKEINVNDLYELHSLSNKKLNIIPENQLWYFRTTWTEILEKTPNWKIKKIWTIDFKKIKQVMKNEINQLNISLSNEDFLWISNFILNSLIIHPFYDGNWKVFWLLNDLFLLKINFFPIFWNKDIEKIHKDVFACYVIDFNKDLLLKKYLEFIISRYKNYKF